MNSTVIIKLKKVTIEKGNADVLLKEAVEYLSNQPKKELYKTKKERFINFLEKESFSQTPERFNVLEKICAENCIFTINTIHNRVLKDMYMSIKTVNNTFKLLVEAGLIKIVNENQSRKLFKTTYFELNDLE